MDLQKSFQTRLDYVLRDLLQRIADEYNIDINDLYELSSGLDTKNTPTTCMHIMTRGKNKGTHCPSKALENGFCGKHQGNALKTIGKVMKTTTPKAKPMTKTQMQIIEWLNTAVPQEETVLKKRSKGLVHEETEMVFNEDYLVIGKLDGKKIVKISPFEVEICERQGWKYDPENVEVE